MKRKSLLPIELEIEILLRLPIKSLLRFKSVCKKWRSSITSSSFIDQHHHISRARDGRKFIFFRYDPIAKSHIISLIDHQASGATVNLEWPPLLDEMVDDNQTFNRVINVFGPVNGIYCLFNRLIHRRVGTLVLWNPATAEYKPIVPPVAFPFSYDFFCQKWRNHWYYERMWPLGLDIGFGFDDKTNDFKVVSICYSAAFEGYCDERWHVRVYDLSSDSWRTIYYFTSKADVLPLFKEMNPFFPRINSCPECVHCYLNGVFHWSAEWDGFKGILSFHMADENFQLIKGPPSTYEDPYQSIWVFKGTLGMVISSFEENGNPCGANVWLMMQYGQEDSWTMLHSFGPTVGLAIVGIPTDEFIFFLEGNGQLISLAFEDQECRKYGLYTVCDSEYHPNKKGRQGVLQYMETLGPLRRVHH